MSYQPPQNPQQPSPWSGGDGGTGEGEGAARDGGPQGPSYDASSQAPRYGVRTPDSQGQGSQAAGAPQFGQRDGGQDGGRQDTGYGQPVSFGQGQGGYQPPAPYPGGGNENPYQQGGYRPQASSTAGRGLGITGLVLGILSVLLCWLGLPIILAVIGLIISIISVVKASRARAGRGFGIAGIILNSIGLLLSALFLVFWVIAGGAFFSLINDPELRPCWDTFTQSEMTAQDQSDFEQCLNSAIDQDQGVTTS